MFIQVDSAHLVVRIGWSYERVYAVTGEGVAGKSEYGYGDSDIENETKAVGTLPVVVLVYYRGYC